MWESIGGVKVSDNNDATEGRERKTNEETVGERVGVVSFSMHMQYNIPQGYRTLTMYICMYTWATKTTILVLLFHFVEARQDIIIVGVVNHL